MNNKPNSQECIFYGRKLSNILCDDINVEKGYVSIGSENDDEIYFGECLEDNKEMIKGRVLITVMDDDCCCIDIDLEDILKFARKNCNGIYERVMKEVVPYNTKYIEVKK